MLAFRDIEFVNGWLLLLLIIIPALVIWFYYKQSERYPTLRMSDLSAFGEEGSLRGQLSILLPMFRDVV